MEFLFLSTPDIFFTISQGHLPIHCGASQGLISTIEAVLAHDCHRSTNEMLTDADQVHYIIILTRQNTFNTFHYFQPVSSLIYLSLVGDHLEAAKWYSIMYQEILSFPFLPTNNIIILSVSTRITFAS